MNSLFSKIFLCDIHSRFKRAFEYNEDLGFKLYKYPDKNSEFYKSGVRKYMKNLGRLITLHDKFTGRK